MTESTTARWAVWTLAVGETTVWNEHSRWLSADTAYTCALAWQATNGIGSATAIPVDETPSWDDVPPRLRDVITLPREDDQP